MSDLISREHTKSMIGDLAGFNTIGRLLDEVPSIETVSLPYLMNRYINSVGDNDEPIWTEAHLKELMNDFYLIPREDVLEQMKEDKE